MTFFVELNFDIDIKVVADNLIVTQDDIYVFIDTLGNEIMSLKGGFHSIHINFEGDHLAGHVKPDGRFVVDFLDGTDADFDTHSVDVQNGDGYYNDFGKYVSYHKED